MVHSIHQRSFNYIDSFIIKRQCSTKSCSRKSPIPFIKAYFKRSWTVPSLQASCLTAGCPAVSLMFAFRDSANSISRSAASGRRFKTTSSIFPRHQPEYQCTIRKFPDSQSPCPFLVGWRDKGTLHAWPHGYNCCHGKRKRLLTPPLMCAPGDFLYQAVASIKSTA